MKDKKMFMHEVSGDVASLEDWKAEFDDMGVERWFGKEATDCEDLHWLDDAPWLIEVELVDGAWSAV